AVWPGPFLYSRDRRSGAVGALSAVLADFQEWQAHPGELCRTVLIELLAWQFASPVRWIETQDVLFASRDDGGLGIERFVEVGVAQSPTVANLASSTLKLPDRRGPDGEVVNIERDASVVFATDEDPVEDEAPAEAASDATGSGNSEAGDAGNGVEKASADQTQPAPATAA